MYYCVGRVPVALMDVKRSEHEGKTRPKVFLDGGYNNKFSRAV